MQSAEWKLNWKLPVIEHGKPTPWNWVVSNPQNFVMHDYVDIGAFTYIDAAYGVVLEEGVQIGSHCSIYSHNTIDDTWGAVVIEKGACIGSHSTIMPGVTIGRGTKVGAYSSVKDNLPAGCLAYGIPAKVRKVS